MRSGSHAFQEGPAAKGRKTVAPTGVIYFDGNIVFGIGPILPINNLPPGVLKVRIKQREDAITKVFLKFWDYIEQWEIEVSPDKLSWQLSVRVGRNSKRR